MDIWGVEINWRIENNRLLHPHMESQVNRYHYGPILPDESWELYMMMIMNPITHIISKTKQNLSSPSAMWLINLADRDLLYGPLKFKAFSLLLKFFVIYCQVFLTLIANKILKPFTLYCVLKRTVYLTTPVSNWLVLLSTCVRNLKPLLKKKIPQPVDYTVEI